MDTRSIFFALTLAATGSLAGPPTLCHPVTPTKGASLLSESEASDGARLVAYLAGEPDALARMETMRRAALSTGDGPDVWKTIARLNARAALESEPGPRASALFNAGFFIHALSEEDPKSFNIGAANGAPGLALVDAAVRLAPNEGAYAFGAALVAHPVMRRDDRPKNSPLTDEPVYNAYLRAAVANAPAGSALESNLKEHLLIWGSSIDSLRRTTAGTR